MPKTIDATPIDKADRPIEEAVASIDSGRIVEESAQAEQTPPPIAGQPLIRKLLIYYDFVRKDGSKGSSRFVIDWAADLRLLADILTIESNIVTSSNGEVISAFVTNWKSLEG